MSNSPAEAVFDVHRHPLPSAVLWDMDGTLVDTEPYWMQAEVELVRAYGGTWSDDDSLAVVGAGLWSTAAAMQDRGVDLGADEIVARLTDEVQRQIATLGVPWRPGAVELLRSLREHGVGTALVTMSVRRMAEQIVAALPFDGFDVLVTGDAVTLPKPHPEAYLTAARLLGLEPASLIAIEDSLPGVAAAVAAGANVIAVPHILPIPESPDHVVWPSLQGRDIGDLAAFLAERTAR